MHYIRNPRNLIQIPKGNGSGFNDCEIKFWIINENSILVKRPISKTIKGLIRLKFENDPYAKLELIPSRKYGHDKVTSLNPYNHHNEMFSKFQHLKW